ncbi:minor tail protein [Mycobacterium phage Eradicator]|nr:minor tail protein [Mycobacterium phage Eradicator]
MTIQGYFVYAREKAVGGDFVQLNPSPVLPPFAHNGLQSNTAYEFYVQTIDNAGWLSEPSDVFEFTTPAHEEGDLLSPADQAMVDQIVEESRAESGQPGVIVQITGPRGSYAKAYGTSVGSTARPLTLDDHFRMGSSTKMFTVVAFFQAVDNGLITLEDTLEQYVPGIPNGTVITMANMLSMRSGIAEYTAGTNTIFYTLFPTWPWKGAEDFLSTMKGKPKFYPGTDYAYTNSNFSLIGMVLEKVDPEHRTIKQIITEDIIEPLGLTETQWPPTGPCPPPTTRSDNINPNFLNSAGALSTNINDYTKFIQAIRDGELISEESHDVWMRTYWRYPSGWDKFAKGYYIPTDYYYGYGMENFGTWYGHPGAFSGGWEASVFFERDSGATIAVHENINTTDPILAAQTRIWVRLAETLYPGTITNDQNWPVPPAPVDLGYDAVSDPLSGFGSASKSFTASAGSTVFVVMSWDRSGSAPSVTYAEGGGALVGSVYHNDSASNGGLAIYRMDNAGSGSAKTVKVKGPGWVSAYAVSFKDVVSVGEADAVFGSGTAHSQAVTVPAGSVTLQVFGAGGGGGPSYDLESVVGARVRAKQEGTNPLLCVNTTTNTGTVNATSTHSNKWSALAVNLQIGAG